MNNNVHFEIMEGISVGYIMICYNYQPNEQDHKITIQVSTEFISSSVREE